MSYGGGLPYDATPPPEDVPMATSAEAGPSLDKPLDKYDADGVDPLDRPLDEYKAPKVIPPHVSELMGRMSQGKVYLLEESPAIIYTDAEERIAKDPRIAALADQLNSHDPTEWLDAVSASSPSPIRHNALYIRSDLVKHLSTSKLFSWSTSLGVKPIGIEWLNDTMLLILFADPASALLGLSLLAKAGFDPAEGDDPLLERSAHSIPLSLLPQAPLPLEDQMKGEELIPENSGDGKGEIIRKRGRGNFSEGNTLEDRLASDLVSKTEENQWNLAEGVDPNARIAIRFGVVADKELRRKGAESEWYKKNGREAGKERINSGRRNVNRRDDVGPISWSERTEISDGGRDFAKRIGRGRARDSGGRDGRRDGGGRGVGRRTAEDLDLELERMARKRGGDGENGDNGGREDMSMDVDEDLVAESRYGQRDRRGGRRQARGKDDLDKELDDMFASRAAT